MTICIQCGSWHSKVLETRKDTRFNWKYRRRRCADCNAEFETYEIDASQITHPEPINPTGKIERRPT